MTLSSFLFYSVAAFSLICILAVLFFERKNPASSLIWILVLIFLPIIGFVLYLFLGSGFRVNRRRKYALKAVEDDIYNNYIVKHLSLGHSRVFSERHESTSRLLTFLKKEGEGIFTDDNNVQIYTDGRDMFSDLLTDLRAAQNNIHLLFYIFRNDGIGREIISILEEKAKSGIEVRVIYDSVGTLMAFDTMFKTLKRNGGQVCAFSPLFSSISSHLRLNYRNHRKIAVIDGTIGYVGGMNIGDEYMGLDKKLSPWRDTHLRITGSAVWFLQERFLMDWGFSSETDPKRIDVSSYFPPPIDTGTIPMQIVSSGPDTFESPIKSGMLEMLYSARKTIYMQTPYFAPDESMADALRIAARSDVDVRLMIPKKGDYFATTMATLGFAREAQAYGVRILLYNGFIHAKTLVVDGRSATIGTANITNRSFTLDFEVNAFIYDKAFAEKCQVIFLDDELQCDPLSEEFFRHQSLLSRAGNNCARLLAPMM
ncbi:MAG: cardiolipin synthase [Planctomycetes bacterium]|nr:cardiolipin synthase [Planctomycetota bacterium]